MAFQLLATKVRIPPQPHHLVQRARLIEHLEREIPRHKLVLVSAPAGYGKTTLLAQWAHASKLPVAWLSVDEDDNNIERFFRYLLTAWDEVQPGIEDSSLGVLLGSTMPDIQEVLSTFLNAASDISDQMVFVIDDFHLVEDPSIHQALTFLIDHLPPAIHFVLAARVEPPLPLARYRARQELLELHADDLQFLEEETDAFLNQVMGLGLGNAQITALHPQLEGWIAGLQLVALSLRRYGQGVEPHSISGRHRFIADYLSEDVLAQQPEDIQRFLLQTSILEHLNGSVCDAVTSSDGAQEMLETLERENLFLVPLDDNREWFRYHRLFAEFLRDQLDQRHPELTPELHRRAARWFLAHDMPDPAFRHAIEGNDLDLTIRIGERYIFVMLHDGELRALQGWLDALPSDWYSAYSGFGLARAGLLAYTGALDACVRCVDEVEQRLVPAETDDTTWQLARVTALRCFIACFVNDVEQAEAHAGEALRNLREDDLSFRVDIHHALGDTYRRNGRWQEAKACYLEALNCSASPTFRALSPHVFGALADLDLRQGRLRDAAGYWRAAQAAIEDRGNWGRVPLPVIGWVHIRMGEILYEWNELALAWDHLSRGLERAELGGDVRALIAGYVIAGRLKLAEGDVETAAEHLERARLMVSDAPFPDWTSRFERLQLELWLAQDKLRAAVNWADEMLEDNSLPRQPESEVAKLATARVLIFKGDGPARDRAQALLGALLQAAEDEGRAAVQIEALALQALANWQRGDRAAAMTSFEQALRLAEPEGYIRLFADLGRPMGRLLQEARSRDVMPDYVTALLSALSDDLSIADPADQALPEPLTPREQEILGLVAAGLTNGEIAEELIISPQTVKKHAGNIYGKLGVRSRTEAVARARALELLG